MVRETVEYVGLVFILCSADLSTVVRIKEMLMDARERPDCDEYEERKMQQEMHDLISYLPENDELNPAVPEHLFPLPDTEQQAGEEEPEQPRTRTFGPRRMWPVTRNRRRLKWGGSSIPKRIPVTSINNRCSGQGWWAHEPC